MQSLSFSQVFYFFQQKLNEIYATLYFKKIHMYYFLSPPISMPLSKVKREQAALATFGDFLSVSKSLDITHSVNSWLYEPE